MREMEIWGGSWDGKVPLTEFDEQLAIASPLVRGQGQDAGHIVVFRGLLLLRQTAKDSHLSQ